jgi:hypothetical protein
MDSGNEMEEYEGILDYIRQIPVIDTHEHLVHSEDLLQGRDDVLQEFLIHYMSSDLISSGLDPEVLAIARDSERDLVYRWKLIEDYWEFCRHTGYGRALDDSIREIYGIDGIRGSTIEELGEKFREANKPGHLKEILKDLCNIELAIIDPWTGRFECDSSLFRRVWQPQNYIIPMPPEFDIVGWLEETYAVEIRSLNDWLEVFERELDENITNGIVGLKSALAYHRPIRFEEVSLEDAATAFRQALEERRRRSPDHNIGLLIPETVQDYVMHHVLSAANERGLFIQFHTGLLEGNRGILSNSNPELLENLFSKYPRVRFDLFHIGYPYWGVTAALAKSYSNVFIDMCWSHIISPVSARNALSDFLDAVPFNKISGFGGDYAIVDAIYGHLKIARENIARVLAEKIGERTLTFSQAGKVAERLLHDNPKEILLNNL